MLESDSILTGKDYVSAYAALPGELPYWLDRFLARAKGADARFWAQSTSKRCIFERRPEANKSASAIPSIAFYSPKNGNIGLRPIALVFVSFMKA